MFELAGISDIEKELDQASERKNGIRNLFKRISTSTTKHLHSVWKDYRGISIEMVENGDFIDAYVVDKYNTYDLARRSDGFKRFISFLLHVSVKAKSKKLDNALYLDDEPDIALHPSGVRFLRDELIKVSRNNYVVYATHSIFMIDGANLHRHLIVSKEDEITTIEEASDSNFAQEEVIFNALGYSIFQHLKPFNLIFEGWRDRRLFEVAMKSSSPAHREARRFFAGIGSCYCKGVKDVGRVTAMLELARRDCFIITDADAPAKEAQKSYRGLFKWLRYDQILTESHAQTGEDFLRYSAFTPALEHLASITSGVGAIPSESQFQGRGNLRVIADWLTAAGVRGDTLKASLNDIKERVFSDLQPSALTDEYWRLLEALRSLIEQAATSSE